MRAFGVRLPVLLPVGVLLAVACTQLVLAHRSGLSPWLGGGFGMFSTTDSWGRRHIHAYALGSGVRRELRIPQELDRERLRALALPSDRMLGALARRLAELPTPESGPPRAVELQVWSVRFDPGDLSPRGVLLRSVEVPVGAPVGG